MSSLPRLASMRCVLLALALLTPLASLTAHEVPRHVAVRAWVAPEPTRVRMLVQIPADAIRDVEWPRRGSLLLDVARVAPYLDDAARLWVADGVTLRDGTRMLPKPVVRAVRAALPGDRAFDRYADALSAIASSPLPVSTAISPLQLKLEVELEIPLTEPVRDLVIEPRWAHLGVTTSSTLILRMENGAERAYTWTGEVEELRVDPRWWHAAMRFVEEGIGHMLGGIDHLLFLLCLVLPYRRLRPLVGIVTAFTVAHSITLFAAALGYAPTASWFAPLVEVLIAASIVYMAIENILGARLERRWLIAFVFGLVHGFGFSSALGDELQFAGAHLVVSLAAFNVGLELAQLGVLIVAVPLLNRLLGRAIPERPGIIVASAFVAHEAWHWMTARFATLQEQPFVMPQLDAAFASTVIGWLMAILALVGVAWLLSSLIRRLERPTNAASVALMTLALFGAALVPVERADAQTRTTMAGVYTPDQAVKGREVFIATCLGCHTTASHTGPAFQIKWFGRPLADLFDYVSNAMPKTAPGTLGEDEYVWLMAYILRLNGMPPGKTELSAEPKLLKAVRIDSTRAGAGAGADAGATVRSNAEPHAGAVRVPLHSAGHAPAPRQSRERS